MTQSKFVFVKRELLEIYFFIYKIMVTRNTNNNYIILNLNSAKRCLKILIYQNSTNYVGSIK